MKKIVFLCVAFFCLVGFADSGVFDPVSLFTSSADLIGEISIKIGTLLVLAGSIYCVFIGWRKYRECADLLSQYQEAIPENHPDGLTDEQYEIVEAEYLDAVDAIWSGEYHSDDDDALEVDAFCDTGAGCCHSDECVYWSGDQCGIGLE